MQYPLSPVADEAVIGLFNGDVWVGGPQAASGRRFRSHFGHVVEVLNDGRIRRVGRHLSYASPWLLVDAPLEQVIERALEDEPGG